MLCKWCRYGLMPSLLAVAAAICLSAQMPPPADFPFEARIAFPDTASLHAFIEVLPGEEVTVATVRGTEATLSLTQTAYDRLLAAGYDVQRVPPPKAMKVPDGYRSHAEVGAVLSAHAETYPEICRLYTLGDSVQGRALWVLRITDKPDLEEDEPEFKYISTIHGNENLGTEMCLNLIDLLLAGYGVDDRLTALVDDTDIWFLPLMNPDGLEANVRQNANGRDLNRSFPAYPTDFVDTYFDGDDPALAGRQPEVAHVMNWTVGNSFVLSANFHTGALVVNYPYDYTPGVPSGQDAPSPDDLIFEDLSLRYAMHNGPMFASTEFENGISNGSAWYSITGGMQDWNYRYAGCMEVTIELSNTFQPPSEHLPQLWEDNREAMLAYLEAVHLGVRGVVTDHATGAPVWAAVKVDGNAQRVYTDPDVGDYHRILLPGSYTLRIEAPGFIPYAIKNVAVVDGAAVRRDAALSTGDINADGIVDARDVQLVVNAVLGIADPFGADVNGGGLSATDIQAVVLRALFRAR